MDDLIQSIRQVAQNLLEQRQVDAVIGFEGGSLPLQATPCFIRNSEDVGRLVWGLGCGNNLANYLRKRQDKVAVVAKGCDARAIVVLLQEHQIERDKVFIIGVPCRGVIDYRKALEIAKGDELISAEESDDSVVLRTRDREVSVSRESLLHASCLACQHPVPTLYDHLVEGQGLDNAKAGNGREKDGVAIFEKKPADERWEYLSKEFNQCIRCYACRNACPLCYCPECFVDCANPPLVSRVPNVTDALVFHLGRAFHTAGRCVSCGACQRACPVGIDISKLTSKIAKDAKTLFDAEPGVDIGARLPLSAFSVDDPQDFIFEPQGR